MDGCSSILSSGKGKPMDHVGQWRCHASSVHRRKEAGKHEMELLCLALQMMLAVFSSPNTADILALVQASARLQ